MKIYEMYRLARSFDTLSKLKQAQVLDFLTQDLGNSGVKIWAALFLIRSKTIQPDDLLAVIRNLVLTCRPKRKTHISNILMTGFKLGGNEIKELIKKSQCKAYLSQLLVLNPTIEEEELALRSIGTTVPDDLFVAIHKQKYKISKEAISKVPPIARLKLLEALTKNSKSFGYNIFENLSKDEFDSLLFTSITRYPQRVSKVAKKYELISQKGITKTITIKGNCLICGSFDISGKVQLGTKEAFSRTYLGQVIKNNNCMFCYRKAEKEILFDIVGD